MRVPQAGESALRWECNHINHRTSNVAPWLVPCVVFMPKQHIYLYLFVTGMGEFPPRCAPPLYIVFRMKSSWQKPCHRLSTLVGELSTRSRACEKGPPCCDLGSRYMGSLKLFERSCALLRAMVLIALSCLKRRGHVVIQGAN